MHACTPPPPGALYLRPPYLYTEAINTAVALVKHTTTAGGTRSNFGSGASEQS